MKAEIKNGPEWHKRYDNIDGTGDMLMGSMLLGFALLSYLQNVIPPHSIWRTNIIASLIFMYAILAAVLGPAYLVRSIIKKRITWPRTGYVAVHSIWSAMLAPKKKAADALPGVPSKLGLWSFAAAMAAVGMVVGGGFMLVTWFVTRHVHGTPIVLGIYGALFQAYWLLIYAFWTWRIGGRSRWKWVLLLFMAAGVLMISLAGSDNFLDLTRRVMPFVGAMWVISGLGTFLGYLRHTQPPAQEPA